MILVQPRTLKIQVYGSNVAGRLSPDLAQMGETFTWHVDRKRKKLQLTVGNGSSASVLRTWKGNPRSTSKAIGLRSVLKALGLKPEELQDQVFDVKVRGKTLEVQF